MRPSRMCARVTPLRNASTQDTSFGIIPSAAFPFATSASSPAASIREISELLVGVVAVDPGDVREIHELLRVERGGDRAGHGVGVDVVRLAGRPHADRRDHRDELLTDQALEDRRVDPADVTDEPEPFVARLDLDEARVLTREPDRVRAVLVQRRHDVAVDLPDQGHARDVDRLRVGDAEPVEELGLLAEPPHEIADLRSASVHDHGIHPDEPHQHDVLREQVRERGIVHGVPAVLDHHGPAAELPDVRERLGQDRGLVVRRRQAHVRPGGAHDVPRFSSMYACDRSVNSIVACSWPARRSQSMWISYDFIVAMSSASLPAATPFRQARTSL